MHAGDDHRRVEGTEDGSADDAGGVVQPLHGIGEGDTGIAGERANDGEGEQCGDEDGEQWGEQQVNAGGDDAAQAGFEFGEYPA